MWRRVGAAAGARPDLLNVESCAPRADENECVQYTYNVITLYVRGVRRARQQCILLASNYIIIIIIIMTNG